MVWARDSGYSELEEQGAQAVMGNGKRKWDSGGCGCMPWGSCSAMGCQLIVAAEMGAGGGWNAVGRAVYDNRNQERALVAMRLAQAKRRAAVVPPVLTPPRPTATATAAPTPPPPSVLLTPPVGSLLGTPLNPAPLTPAPAAGPVHNPPASSPLAGAACGSTGTVTARAATPTTLNRGPLRPEFLTTSEVAAGEATAALRARWTHIYGRKASTYNLGYLRRAVVAPGLDVGPQRMRAKPVVAELVAREALAAAAAGVHEEGNRSADGEGDSLSEDSNSQHGQAYSVVDSEEEPGEEPRLPQEVDDNVRVVTRAAPASSSSSEEEGSSGTSGADSDDARELALLIERQQCARRDKRKRKRVAAEEGAS